MGTDEDEGEDSGAGLELETDPPRTAGCLLGVEASPPLLCGGCPPPPPPSRCPEVAIHSVSAIAASLNVHAFVRLRELSQEQFPGAEELFIAMT